MTEAVTMTGKDFKALVTGVTKFPTVGHFGGSEMVNLAVTGGKAQCTTLGVVLSRSMVPAAGELPLIAIDERLIGPFASLHGEATKVVIAYDDREVVIRARGRKITAPYREGTQQDFPKTSGDGISVTESLGSRVRYLSEVAYSDLSRPDMSCVMVVPDGRAMACSSRCIAVLRCHSGHDKKIAMPLPMAKALNTGDTIFPGLKETVVKNGIAKYSMPSPLIALEQFPVSAIDAYGQTDTKVFATVKGSLIARAVLEADSCMGAISRLEMIVRIAAEDGKMVLTTENGSARFLTRFPAIKSVEGQVDLPMEEMTKICTFLSGEDKVVLSTGTKNNETMIKFRSGWVMFPKLRK